MDRRPLMRLGMVGVLIATVAASSTAIALASANKRAISPPSYRLKLAKTFHVSVPHDAIVNGWCYDQALVNPRTRTFFLADAANNRVTSIKQRTGRVGGIGKGRFTGIVNCHNHDFDGEGPTGLALSGGDIYVGNGNSHVLGFSLKTGREISNTDTGGKFQADDLLVVGHYLIVTNDAEKRPFISFINLDGPKRPVVARYMVPGAHGLGGMQWWHNHLYLSVSSSTRSKGGEVDKLSISNTSRVRVVHRFVFSTCQPAGLAVASAGRAAVGCGNGNNQEILNLATGQRTAVKGFMGVDGVAAYKGDFFYTSFINPELIVANSAGKVIQTFTFTVGTSHIVTVNRANGDVWLPEDKGVVALFKPRG
jgi:hypothetical protein